MLAVFASLLALELRGVDAPSLPKMALTSRESSPSCSARYMSCCLNQSGSRSLRQIGASHAVLISARHTSGSIQTRFVRPCIRKRWNYRRENGAERDLVFTESSLSKTESNFIVQGKCHITTFQNFKVAANFVSTFISRPRKCKAECKVILGTQTHLQFQMVPKTV